MDIVKVVSNYTKNIKDLGELKKKILNDQNNEELKTHYILILKESLNNFQLMKNKYGNSWAIQREQDANKILKVSDKEEEIFINLMADFYNKNI
ncbi:hypothetical protein MCEMKE138_01098 [Candidatus Pelagibacterales bacterium]|jgi:hypothetical protein